MVTNEEKKEYYSFTKLSAFHTCKYGYKLTYIDKIKGEGNCFSSYGTEAHSLLERYAKGELELWDIAEAYEWEFDLTIPEPFPIMITKKGKLNLRDLYYQQGLKFFQNFGGYSDLKILGVEEKFTHDIDDWVFNGVIDLIFEDTDGKLVILDYKSKGEFKTKKEQEEYTRQLLLYSLHIKDKYGKYPDELRFYMFRKNKILPIVFNEKSLEEAINWAKETVNQIRTCKEYNPTCEEFYGEQLCNHRGYCEYKGYTI